MTERSDLRTNARNPRALIILALLLGNSPILAYWGPALEKPVAFFTRADVCCHAPCTRLPVKGWPPGEIVTGIDLRVPGPRTLAVVATMPIRRGTSIRNCIEIRRVSKEQILPLDELSYDPINQADNLIGFTAVKDIAAGEVLYPGQFANTEDLFAPGPLTGSIVRRPKYQYIAPNARTTQWSRPAPFLEIYNPHSDEKFDRTEVE